MLRLESVQENKAELSPTVITEQAMLIMSDLRYSIP